MYKEKRILALIPARGGSKGIKDKNIIDLCGKPLISYTIEAAKSSKYIDEIIVSTDSDRIAEISREYGADVPFKRPESLAGDASTTLDVVMHAIGFFREKESALDTLVLLQPTQPLRTSEDIDMAIEKHFLHEEKSLVSVCEVDDNPILIRTLEKDDLLIPLINMGSTCRRQDMPVYYRVNGCIYINKVCEINETTSFNDNELAYVMPQERSIDIDELKDLYLAQYYLNKKAYKEKKNE